MNATIDIKTPSGQSLEGYPLDIELDGIHDTDDLWGNSEACMLFYKTQNITLHPGDTITIKIV